MNNCSYEQYPEAQDCQETRTDSDGWRRLLETKSQTETFSCLFSGSDGRNQQAAKPEKLTGPQMKEKQK